MTKLQAVATGIGGIVLAFTTACVNFASGPGEKYCVETKSGKLAFVIDQGSEWATYPELPGTTSITKTSSPSGDFCTFTNGGYEGTFPMTKDKAKMEQTERTLSPAP